MSDTFKVRLGAEYTGGPAFDQMERDLRDIEKAGYDAGAALRAGIGIDLGGRLVQSLAEGPEILEEWIQKGVKFNATMESARLGVAGVFRQFAGDRFPTLDAAEEAASRTVDKLKIAADTTNATFSQLLGTYQATTGALFAAGIADAQQQVRTISLLANAVSSVITDKSQLVQESRAILTGNITPDAMAANTFGITSADIARAKEAGKLVEYLEQKLGAFAEVGERGASTYAIALDTLEASLESLAGEVAKPIFEELRGSFISLNEELNKPEVVEHLRSLGVAVAEITKGGLAMLSWVIENIHLLKAMAAAGTAVVFAFAGLKLAELILGFGQWALKQRLAITATEASTTSIQRETAALQANTTARAANASSGARRASNVQPSDPTVPILDRKAWLERERSVRQGGTTYANYRNNGIGGATLGPDGTALSRGMVQRVPTPLSTAGSNFGSAVQGLGGAVAYGQMVASIFLLIDALNQLATVTREGRAQAASDDKDVNRRIGDSLLAKAQSATSMDRAGVQRSINAERQRLKGLQLSTQGEGAQLNLGRSLERLLEIENELEIAIPKNDTAGEAERAAAQRLAAKEKSLREAQEKDAYDREAQIQNRRTEDARSAMHESTVGDSPRGRLDAMQVDLQTARSRFAQDANDRYGFAGEVKADMSVNQLHDLAATANSPRQIAELTERVAEIARLEAEIHKEREASGRELNEQMASEVEIYRQREAQRLQDGEALDDQMAKEVEIAQRRNELITGLTEELEIQRLVTTGKDHEAKLLGIQRDLRKEIASIEQQQLAPAEEKKAKDLATQTAELERQKAIIDQQKKQTEAWEKASDVTNDIKPGFDENLLGSRGARARAKDRATFLRNWDKDAGKTLTDAEVDPAAIARAREAAGVEYDRAAKEKLGRIGGTATTSARENMAGGLTANSTWEERFKPGGSGTLLDVDATKGGFGGGKTAQSDWDRMFNRPALGDVVPSSPNNAPQIAGSPKPSAPETGAEALGKAGKDVSGAANEVKTAANNFGAQSAAALQAAAASLASIDSQLSGKLSDLETRLASLETTVSSL